MKTAVSIPDDVFEKADLLAKELRMSRSELYATALRALLADEASVTERLNRVHVVPQTDDAVTSAARAAFSRSEW